MGCPWSLPWPSKSPEDQIEELKEQLKELEGEVSRDERNLARLAEQAKNKNLSAATKRAQRLERLTLQTAMQQKRTVCGDIRNTVKTMEGALQQSEYVEQQEKCNKAMQDLKKKLRKVVTVTEKGVELRGTLNERSKEQTRMMHAAGQVAEEDMKEFLDEVEEEDEELYGMEEDEEEEHAGEKEEERRATAVKQAARQSSSMASSSRAVDPDKEFERGLENML